MKPAARPTSNGVSRKRNRKVSRSNRKLSHKLNRKLSHKRNSEVSRKRNRKLNRKASLRKQHGHGPSRPRNRLLSASLKIDSAKPCSRKRRAERRISKRKPRRTSIAVKSRQAAHRARELMSIKRNSLRRHRPGHKARPRLKASSAMLRARSGNVNLSRRSNSAVRPCEAWAGVACGA